MLSPILLPCLVLSSLTSAGLLPHDGSSSSDFAHNIAYRSKGDAQTAANDLFPRDSCAVAQTACGSSWYCGAGLKCIFKQAQHRYLLSGKTLSSREPAPRADDGGGSSGSSGSSGSGSGGSGSGDDGGGGGGSDDGGGSSSESTTAPSTTSTPLIIPSSSAAITSSTPPPPAPSPPTTTTPTHTKTRPAPSASTTTPPPTASPAAGGGNGNNGGGENPDQTGGGGGNNNTTPSGGAAQNGGAQPASDGGRLSGGAIAGIVVGAIAGLILVGVVGFVIGRRRKRANAGETNMPFGAMQGPGSEEESYGTPTSPGEKDGSPFQTEDRTQELDAQDSERKPELPANEANPAGRAELDGQRMESGRSELPG